MPKLTHEEFDRRTKKAMEPPTAMQQGQGFSPNVQRLRQSAQQRRPAGRPMPS